MASFTALSPAGFKWIGCWAAVYIFVGTTVTSFLKWIFIFGPFIGSWVSSFFKILEYFFLRFFIFSSVISLVQLLAILMAPIASLSLKENKTLFPLSMSSETSASIFTVLSRNVADSVTMPLTVILEPLALNNLSFVFLYAILWRDRTFFEKIVVVLPVSMITGISIDFFSSFSNFIVIVGVCSFSDGWWDVVCLVKFFGIAPPLAPQTGLKWPIFWHLLQVAFLALHSFMSLCLSLPHRKQRFFLARSSSFLLRMSFPFVTLGFSVLVLPFFPYLFAQSSFFLFW